MKTTTLETHADTIEKLGKRARSAINRALAALDRLAKATAAAGTDAEPGDKAEIARLAQNVVHSAQTIRKARGKAKQPASAYSYAV